MKKNEYSVGDVVRKRSAGRCRGSSAGNDEGDKKKVGSAMSAESQWARNKGGESIMIQMQTNLDVADIRRASGQCASGARWLQEALRHHRDVIVVSVRRPFRAAA